MTDRRSRRWFLGAAGLSGIGVGAGCLRLTGSEQTPTAGTPTPSSEGDHGGDEPSAGTDTDASGEPEPESESPTAESSATIRGAESVDFPFVDARNRMAQSEATVMGGAPVRRWRADPEFFINTRIFSGPILAADNLVVNSTRGVAAFSRADGSLAWRLGETLVDSYGQRGRIVHHDGSLVFVGANRRTDDWELVLVDPSTGELVDRVVLPIPPGGANADVEAYPAVSTVDPASDTAYVVATSRRDSAEQFTDLLAVDLTSLSVRWEHRLAERQYVLEDVAVDGDLLVLTSDEVGEDQDNVLAFDTADRGVRWSRRIRIGESIPVVGDEYVYLPRDTAASEEPSLVRAHSRTDGTVAWTFEVGSAPRTGVTLGPDGLYVVSNGTLYRLDPGAGTATWSYSPDGEPSIGGGSSELPIVNSETVLLGSGFGSDGGRIRAVAKGTGQLQWSVDLPEGGVFSPLAVDDTLYTVGRDPKEDTSAMYAYR